MAGPSHARAVDLTQEEDDEEDWSQQDAALECYGCFKSQVVGVRYYNGAVRLHEMVKMTREPHNPYDANAIRVDNVLGDMVGHIKREEAMFLAPLMDNSGLRIEGVTAGPKGVYKLPIMVFCFGPPASRNAIVQQLRRGGMLLGGVDPLNPMEAAAGGPSTSAAGGSGFIVSQAALDQSIENLWDALSNESEEQMLLQADAAIVTSGLYPHQQAALAWMVERENSSALPPFWEPCDMGKGQLGYVNTLTNFSTSQRPAPLRGGLLADDMGLGKTLTIIALIATCRPGVNPQLLVPVKGLLIPPEPEAAGAGGKQQDEDEVAEPKKKRQKRAEGSSKSSKGGSKSKGAAAASSGSLLQATQEAAASTMSKKQANEAKRMAAAAEAASPPPVVPAAGGPRATLVVCPLSVMSNWQTQIEQHTQEGALKVYTYHGSERNKSPSFLSQQDVVITTYGTMAQDMSGHHSQGLHAVQWLRVVLDEGHTIKNSSSAQAQAAMKLKAERRWAVTGTPIQNSVSDVHGLCAFLHLQPLDDRAIFNRVLSRPIRSRDKRGITRLQVLMGTVGMRRTKETRLGGRPLVLLPSRTVHVVPVQLTPEDRAKYDRLELEGTAVVQGLMATDELLSNYTAVLQIILRLRQMCDATSLCPEALMSSLMQQVKQGKKGGGASKKLTAEEKARLLGLLQAAQDAECPICLSQLNEPVITLCGHPFCRMCIESVLLRDKPKCPMCRADVGMSDLLDLPPELKTDEAAAVKQEQQQQAGAAADGQKAVRGAKISELLVRLKANQEQDAAAGGGGAPTKAVVFGQFTGMLDLVGAALREEGIVFTRLDGSVSAKGRADALQSFSNTGPGAPRVMLVSLRAGGVGLNLTAASQVHMLDPWWNPAVEEQAADRVHRLGQQRAVNIFRYIVQDSIEERMLQLQERKRELSSTAFNRRKGAESRLMQLEDVCLLMRL